MLRAIILSLVVLGIISVATNLKATQPSRERPETLRKQVSELQKQIRTLDARINTLEGRIKVLEYRLSAGKMTGWWPRPSDLDVSPNFDDFKK